VHLTLFPEGFENFNDDALAAKWETIRDVRRVVTGALELERAAKNIGSSLEASPMIYVSDANIFNTLFDLDLAEVCITSNAMATNDAAPANAFTLPDVPGVAVVVEKAVGTKCARSWKILPTVGEDAEYPDVSPRDAQALREWKALAEGERPAEAAAAPVALVAPQHVEHASQVKEASEQAAPENVTAPKPARKVRAGKPSESTEAVKAETPPTQIEKAPAAEEVVEAKRPKAAKVKAKKAKARKAKTAPKKAVAKKAIVKKAKTRKAAKSKKASSVTKDAKKAATKKAAAKNSAKKAGKKKAAKKPSRKPPVTKAKKKKKKAR
jgi:isoleucyl-tRNA synthetase